MQLCACNPVSPQCSHRGQFFYLQSLVDGGQQHNEAEEEGCHNLKWETQVQTKVAFASIVVTIIITACRGSNT